MGRKGFPKPDQEVGHDICRILCEGLTLQYRPGQWPRDRIPKDSISTWQVGLMVRDLCMCPWLQRGLSVAYSSDGIE